jgi:hypothetical protein
MSEDGGVMFSQETAHGSPDIGNSRMRAKELWVIGGFIGSGAVGHRADDKLLYAMKRNCEQTGGGQGVREPALKPCLCRKDFQKIGQYLKPDLGKPAVRDFRGASGNVTMVEL